MMVIAAPFVFSHESAQNNEVHFSGIEIAGVDLVYVLMTWGMILLFRALGRRKRNIIATTRPSPAADAPSP
jgi:hypothetical protein